MCSWVEVQDRTPDCRHATSSLECFFDTLRACELLSFLLSGEKQLVFVDFPVVFFLFVRFSPQFLIDGGFGLPGRISLLIQCRSLLDRQLLKVVELVLNQSQFVLS